MKSITSKNNYLSVCAIFKNEARFLREWIVFHLIQGVQKFYLYNNFSEDDYLSVLEPFIKRGQVELIEWPYKFSQLDAYRDCINKHKTDSRWIAFIDLDEFLFCTNGQKLTEFLKDFEDYPGVQVNWQIFGSSGFIEEPAGLVIENYIKKAVPDFFENRHTKTIVNPEKFWEVYNPHRFKFKWWRNSVDENFRPVRISLDEYFGALTNTVSINKIRINHYTVKAYNTFLKKKNRGRATCDRLRSDEYFKKQDRNEIEDKIIFQFLPEIKQWYQKNVE